MDMELTLTDLLAIPVLILIYYAMDKYKVWKVKSYMRNSIEHYPKISIEECNDWIEQHNIHYYNKIYSNPRACANYILSVMSNKKSEEENHQAFLKGVSLLREERDSLLEYKDKYEDLMKQIEAFNEIDRIIAENQPKPKKKEDADITCLTPLVNHGIINVDNLIKEIDSKYNPNHP